MDEIPEYDFLVIGSGVAGMTFAIKAAKLGRVAILTKRDIKASNSSYAQGGIAAVWDDEDSFASHAADTMEAGAGLCNPDVVRLVVEEGPLRVQELIELGAEFDRDQSKEGKPYSLGLEGGHSARRVLHAADRTGAEIVDALADGVQAEPNIDVYEHHHAVDLLIDQKFGLATGKPQCWGAYALDTKLGEVRKFTARVTLLATGGTGKVYIYTSNPDVASGDGLAMAYRAGASVANLEFIQFHPTCLFHPEAKSFLVTEALRGEGAVLRRPNGESFMADYDARAELAPRDIVARAIDQEMKRNGYDNVFLDATGLDAEFLRGRFPVIHAECLQYGIDITAQPIPVVPAAHYMCGGVMTDTNGETAIPRLYAAGEVAHTGLHGANRLASNSLLEGLVFAHRAFVHAKALLSKAPNEVPTFPEWLPGGAVDINESVVITHNWDEIRRMMWNYVGIVRSDRRLARASARINMIRQEIQQYYWDFRVTRDLLELRNIALVADLIIRCARTRRENRGLHFSIDCSERDDTHWLRDTVI